jgi:hypothetical protein
MKKDSNVFLLIQQFRKEINMGTNTKSIGNFAYVKDDGDYFTFQDNAGNQVVYTDRSRCSSFFNATSVFIKNDSMAKLLPLFTVYLKKFVGDEELQDEGEKIFSKAKIIIHRSFFDPDHGRGFFAIFFDTNTHLGFSAMNIGQEIMASLSEVRLYKAIAPPSDYKGFVRHDVDEDNSVRYLDTRYGISVSFKYAAPSHYLCAKMESGEDVQTFIVSMYIFLTTLVRSHTDQKFIRTYRRRHYPESRKRGGSIDVRAESNDGLAFYIQVNSDPIRGSFPEVEILEWLMEHLRTTFKEQHRESV